METAMFSTAMSKCKAPRVWARRLMWIGCKQQRNTKRIVTRVGATVEVVTQDDNDDDEVMIQRSDAARESDVRAQPLNNGCVMSCDVV